jgi:hypothetical protein
MSDLSLTLMLVYQGWQSAAINPGFGERVWNANILPNGMTREQKLKKPFKR